MITTKSLIAGFQKALDDKTGYIYGIRWEKWTAAKQEAYVKKYANDSDRKLSCEIGGKWIGHYVTDCSGLFAKVFADNGGEMYHGSNTMWRNWCIDKGKLINGKRTDGKTLIPGTAVFTGTETQHNHVGLYIGDGWVIEAQGTRNGVVKSKVNLSKWTYWGELKGVDYGSNSASTPVSAPSESKDDKLSTDSRPVLKRGSKGEYVTLLQTKLQQKGYDLGNYGIDGDFGSATEKAVRQFQEDHDLTVDGIVGASTWKALDQAGTNLYTVTIQHLTKYQAEALRKKYDGCSYMKEEGR